MTKNVQNQNTIIMEAEERCIDRLMEGLMTLDKILYGGLTDLNYHDLWRIYRDTDASKLEQLFHIGLPVRDALAKLLWSGANPADKVLARKVEAMSDDEAEELAERIGFLDEVRRVLDDEVVTF
jgi:hypothetical protein